jgi:hypothetical protein
VLGEADGLPPLPDVGFSLHVPRPLSPAARRVAALVRSVVAGEGASAPLTSAQPEPDLVRVQSRRVGAPPPRPVAASANPLSLAPSARLPR